MMNIYNVRKINCFRLFLKTLKKRWPLNAGL